MKKYILALDQGTTSSRAILFDHTGRIQSIAQKEFTQIFPQPGWVEHDPNGDLVITGQLWPQKQVVKIGADPAEIAAIGITNQRETTIVWDRETGEPVYNAIVWQDRQNGSVLRSIKTIRDYPIKSVQKPDW